MTGKTILMENEWFERVFSKQEIYYSKKPYCVPKTCIEASYVDAIRKMHNALRFILFKFLKDTSLKCIDKFGTYLIWDVDNVQAGLKYIEGRGHTPLIRYQGGKHSCYGGDE